MTLQGILTKVAPCGKYFPVIFLNFFRVAILQHSDGWLLIRDETFEGEKINKVNMN